MDSSHVDSRKSPIIVASGGKHTRAVTVENGLLGLKSTCKRGLLKTHLHFPKEDV